MFKVDFDFVFKVTKNSCNRHTKLLKKPFLSFRSSSVCN